MSLSTTPLPPLTMTVGKGNKNVAKVIQTQTMQNQPNDAISACAVGPKYPHNLSNYANKQKSITTNHSTRVSKRKLDELTNHLMVPHRVFD